MHCWLPCSHPHPHGPCPHCLLPGSFPPALAWPASAFLSSVHGIHPCHSLGLSWQPLPGMCTHLLGTALPLQARLLLVKSACAECGEVTGWPGWCWTLDKAFKRSSGPRPGPRSGDWPPGLPSGCSPGAGGGDGV